MSENALFIWICVLIIVANVFFNGDPDLVDALIKYLLK